MSAVISSANSPMLFNLSSSDMPTPQISARVHERLWPMLFTSHSETKPCDNLLLWQRQKIAGHVPSQAQRKQSIAPKLARGGATNNMAPTRQHMRDEVLAQ